jgi:pimeloyl-ACP methyl ester carboxylesterase
VEDLQQTEGGFAQMARRERVGGFRSPDGERRYLQAYETLVSRWPVPCEEIDVPTRYGPTHVRRSGSTEGRPIVLVHPMFASSVSYYRVVGPFAERHPVYALDTIGTPGRSVQTRPVHGQEDIARWFDDTLVGLGLTAVHVVGYSEGGWVAIFAAVGAPRRIASLSLIEPGGALYHVRAEVLLRMVVTGLRVITHLGSPERVMTNFSRWLGPDTQLTGQEMALVLAAARGYRQGLPFPRTLTDEQLASIATPTLVLFGANTVLYEAAKAAERASQCIPGVQVEIIPQAGHDLPAAHPNLVTDRVLQFIQRSSTPYTGREGRWGTPAGGRPDEE